MKALLPVAGIGSRLRPQTNTVPKAMVHVAGKPMLGHIIDDLVDAGITDIVLIIGYMKEQIIDYINQDYTHITVEFVVQKEMLGLGHAIWTCKDLMGDEDCLIVLGDTIYNVDMKKFIDSENSVLGLRSVEDPRRFGVAETTSDNKHVTKLVEKPDDPKSNLAIVGLYYIKNTIKLMTALEYLIANNIRTKNEFQLTDALQSYLEQDEIMDVFEIEDWFDCGQADVLLDTNRQLLSQRSYSFSCKMENSIIIEPCVIDSSVKLTNCVIGPNVSIGKNSFIKNSIISESIIAEDCTINSKCFKNSIIGAKSNLNETPAELNLGAFTQSD